MADVGDDPTPGDLPPECIEMIDGLNETELRAVIDYAQERKQSYPEVTDRIEAKEGEEILRIEDRGAYTEVVKKQPCDSGCADCPHGPYLYHVQEEENVDGESNLHWTYLGRIRE